MTSLELEQVIVLSRHGIRTPLPNTLDCLTAVTPKNWPQWQFLPGYLTTRGGTLESYFGHYLVNYLANLDFTLTSNDVFIYANSLQRTVATAQYFNVGAFAGLDIPVRHRYPIERMDAVFNPIIRDSSSTFKNRVLDDLKRHTGSSQLIDKLNQNLASTYDLLSDILDYKHSALYQQYRCEFSQLPTQIDIIKDEEPILIGPLALGTAIADAFTLQYYCAFAKQDIAWGEISTSLQWQMITNVKNQYLNLLFQSQQLAAHLALPLVEFITMLFTEQKHKFNLLVGHDSNIASLLSALGFQSYQLPEQYEKAPIGGKVVFYRYYDKQDQQHYFKAEYIYQTFEQIHLAQPLTSMTPPKHFTLNFTDLNPNSQGLYLWQEVSNKLHDFLVNA
ncbi:histidine-type phosphatase [Orbus wheelerorum]|uniref:histidine-type phosphatase n=1 Tax=Orbus wheelerorum TaxID=3074111 RepID=UPI00370DBA55